MLTYPHFPARTTHDLSGVWDFAFLGDSDFDKLDPSNIRFADKMAVPGVFDATPAYAGKRGVACYEEYQAEYLGIVCRKVMEDPEITGVSLWQFCDCRTFASAKALGRPRTFNNKGTFDEYRRPKQAAQVVRRWFRDDE